MRIVASNKKVLEKKDAYASGRSHEEVRMRLTMQQRQAVMAKAAARYQRSRKKEKGLSLRELVALTEYSRVYARRVLRQHGGRVQAGKRLLELDIRKRAPRCRPPFYDEAVKAALVRVWKMMDYICGKRLQPALPELVTVLERHNELQHCDAVTKARLLQISAASIDRLLRPRPSDSQYELRGQDTQPNQQPRRASARCR